MEERIANGPFFNEEVAFASREPRVGQLNIRLHNVRAARREWRDEEGEMLSGDRLAWDIWNVVFCYRFIIGNRAWRGQCRGSLLSLSASTKNDFSACYAENKTDTSVKQV